MAMVSLVRPRVMVAKKSPASPTCPPIGLAYVASSLVAAGHDVKVVDALGEAPAQFLESDDPRFLLQGLAEPDILQQLHPQTQVIGLSCMFSYEWPHIRSFLHKIREMFPMARIILGGEHAAALPEFCLQDCAALDACVMGEGEETMIDLANFLPMAEVHGIAFRENGKIIKTPNRQRIRAVDDIPKPAWDLFPLENYLASGYGRGVNRGRNMPILSSRGCPYRCTFCSNEAMWTPRWIPRDPKLVVEEIREYIEKYQVNNFDFYDLTTVVNRTWTVNFCREIIASGLKFSWQLASGTRSEAIDEEVSILLFKAGCTNISYAPESGSKTVLERVQKKVDLTKLKKSMRGSEKHGIICKANVLIGFPGESHREIWESLWFCVLAAATGIHDLSVYPFSPYPGSQLFRNLQANGTIPEINDEYFYDLALATELSGAPPSYSEHVSDRMLGLYRYIGIILFYGTSFSMRPWRILQTIKNVFGETQETLLESVLHDKFVRRWKLNQILIPSFLKKRELASERK